MQAAGEEFDLRHVREYQLFAMGLSHHGEILCASCGGRSRGGPRLFVRRGGFGLRSPVKPCDSLHPDLGHGFHRAVLGEVFARLKLADDLELSAFREASGVFCYRSRETVEFWTPAGEGG